MVEPVINKWSFADGFWQESSRCQRRVALKIIKPGMGMAATGEPYDRRLPQSLRECMEHIARLHEATGKPADAAAWRNRIDKVMAARQPVDKDE